MQKSTPVVLNLLIINGLCYLAQNLITFINVSDWGALHYISSPNFKPHQFITYMFLHDTDGFSHLLFNMFGLWMFGSVLENFWGSKRFLLFYLACGVGAGIVTQFTIPFSGTVYAKSAAGLEYLSQPGATLQMLLTAYKAQYMTIGASGAIMGIMAAFAYLFPNTEMFIMFIPIPVKAKFVIPVFVLIDLLGGLGKFGGTNVAHFAHLGGALIGFLLVYYWNKTNRKTFY
jgi:membrane associated rhomboid family serine protease